MVSCNRNFTKRPGQWQWRATHMNHMLREVIAGPLQGKQVIFMVDESTEEHLWGSTVLSAAVTPYVILSFPQHWEDADTDLHHSIELSKIWLSLCSCLVSVAYTCPSTYRHHSKFHILVLP